LVPLRGGKFVPYIVGPGDKMYAGAPIEESDFYKIYTGVTLAPVTPPAPSKEELKKDSASTPKNSGGLSVTVIQIKGVAIVKVPGVDVIVLQGKVMPMSTLNELGRAIAAGKTAIVGRDLTGTNGTFSIPLPPGEYTVIVNNAGKLSGNSNIPTSWPSVKISDSMRDYDFRIY
jgi:hypothetical protein